MILDGWPTARFGRVALVGVNCGQGFGAMGGLSIPRLGPQERGFVRRIGTAPVRTPVPDEEFAPTGTGRRIRGTSLVPDNPALDKWWIPRMWDRYNLDEVKITNHHRRSANRRSTGYVATTDRAPRRTHRTNRPGACGTGRTRHVDLEVHEGSLRADGRHMVGPADMVEHDYVEAPRSPSRRVTW